ncbi:MAG: LysR family transcriptional regulator [Oscillospiraceae bacterium]|nr:LysR family transcriptional regulator [Oscillospiraceae bacterium]
MNTEYLKYFIYACNCGSIQSASKKLWISSQGLSQGLSRLESAVGGKLLERTQSGVNPTPFGREFLKYAVAVDAEVQKLDEFVDMHKQHVKNTITIGTIGQTKFLGALNLCMANYREMHPEDNITFNCISMDSAYDLMDSVSSGTIDIGWMFTVKTNPKFVYRALSAHSRLVLLISADSFLKGRENVAFDELRDINFISAGQTDSFANLARDLCIEHGFRPKEVFHTTENTVIAKLIDNGTGGILLRENYCQSIAKFCTNAIAVPISPEIKIASSLVVNPLRLEDDSFKTRFEFICYYLQSFVW